MSPKTRPVLAVEDEEADRFILELAFERAGLRHPLIVLEDGQEAVEYLTGIARHADPSDHPLPALLIVDLKMPRMNGFELLAWLSTRPELRDIPAVVLSSSADESDLTKARELGAREYFVKPHRFDQFIEIVQQMGIRWLGE